MSLQYILGPSGSGKSMFIYDKITKEAQANMKKRFLVIVPEQYTMSTQRMLVNLHPNHCIMNIDVLSFNRLAYRVFEELGQSLADSMLDDTGKSLVLRKLASEQMENLGALKGNITRAGYIAQIKSLISEMTQYNITPDTLRQMIELPSMSMNFKRKAADLLIMYEAFLEFTEGRYVTTESLLSVLNTYLEDSVMVRDSVIVLDGFTGFTPVQYQLFENILKLADKVYVTVTCDPKDNIFDDRDESDLFFMSRTFISRMQKIAQSARTLVDEPEVFTLEKPSRHGDNEPLRFLSNSIYRSGNHTYAGSEDASDAISIFCQADPREELKRVAVEISKMIRTGEFKYSDFAVVSANVENYRYLVPSVFDDYSIPYFIDAKTEIVFHPFVEAIDAALELVESNFDRESVFRYLRSGFIESDTRMVDIMENYVLATGIKGYRKYAAPFTVKATGFDDATIASINAFKDKTLAPFLIFYKSVTEKKITVRHFGAALRELLDCYDMEAKIDDRGQAHLAAGRQVKAKEYQQIYAIVMSVLTRFEEILGDEIMTITEFHEIFSAGLNSAKIGVIPPGNDHVVVGDMERTRLDGIKVLFLVGASDDAIPKPLSDGGILSQLEREQLLAADFEMAPSDRQKTFMQRFYLYLTLTKPSGELIVLYPKVDSDGGAVRPSYLIGMLMHMFDLRVKGQEGFSFEELILNENSALDHLTNLLHTYTQSGGDGLSYEQKAEMSLLLGWYKQKDESACEKLLDTVFFSHVSQISPNLYIEALSEHTSISKLEAYNSCPYKYFLNYVLRLGEREIYALNSMDLGNLYHGVLEHYGQNLLDRNLTWHDITDDQNDEVLQESVQQAYGDIYKAQLLEDPTQRYIIQSVYATMLKVVDILRFQVKKGSFEPKVIEHTFMEELTEGQTKGQTITVKGKIDRADVFEKDGKVFLRIIDYKSSAHEVDLSKCAYGLSLQLPVYLGAMTHDYMEKQESDQVFPAGMFYFLVQNPIVTAAADTEEDKLFRAIVMDMRMTGKALLDEDNATATEEDMGKPSIVAYGIGNGKDGLEGKDWISPDDIETVLAYARYKAGSSAENIRQGRFDISPVDEGDRKGCDYCKFHGVCGFDTRLEGFDFCRKLPMEDPVEYMRTCLAEEEISNGN